MPLKPIRPAPLPPSKNNTASSVSSRKHDDNNNKHLKQSSRDLFHPTVIRPKQNGQQQGTKKKPPPPRPAPPKVNKSGIGKSNFHGKQNPLHISSLLEDDLASIFGDCNTNSDRPMPKSQCQSINRKSSHPPRFVRRSMKKRAPNPLGNSAKNNNALIDFDSPAPGLTPSNNISYTVGEEFQGKSLLDLDDPFLISSSNQSVNLPKSTSLPVNSTFQDFPTYSMNGMEKCENYVATINSMSCCQAIDEQLQKKQPIFPQNNSEHVYKENKVVSMTLHQPTVIYPVKPTKNKLAASQSEGQISSASFSQKQNVLSNSTVSSRSSQQKDGATLFVSTEHMLSVNWENASSLSNFNNTSTETDHSASPFSDISSHLTVSSVDSSDELYFTNESLPEPEFPPPPPPAENLPTENGSKTSTNHTASQFCKALYDFEPESSEELGFKQGEIIIFEKKVTDDWWQGSINDQRGMFPSSYVEICNNKKMPEPEQRSCIVKALYQFDGEEEGDLCFKAGDEIRVLSRINKDWLFGECNGIHGQFPASFVKQMHSNKGLCLARYPFVGENSDELSFEEGDKIIVTEYISDDWWKGMVSNNHSKVGIFPCTFVEKIDTM